MEARRSPVQATVISLVLPPTPTPPPSLPRVQIHRRPHSSPASPGFTQSEWPDSFSFSIRLCTDWLTGTNPVLPLQINPTAASTASTHPDAELNTFSQHKQEPVSVASPRRRRDCTGASQQVPPPTPAFFSSSRRRRSRPTLGLGFLKAVREVKVAPRAAADSPRLWADSSTPHFLSAGGKLLVLYLYCPRETATPLLPHPPQWEEFERV